MKRINFANIFVSSTCYINQQRKKKKEGKCHLLFAVVIIQYDTDNSDDVDNNDNGDCNL